MQIFVSMSVGALIGLFTNWLAIMMLFRPWKEWKLFGKRLPLTPGLIPRRQDELADKMGQIVQEDLLTPEGLAKSLKRADVEFAVKRAAVQSLGDALNESPTLGELAVRLFNEDTIERSEQLLVDKAVCFLRSEFGRAKLELMADSLFEHLRGSLSTSEVRGELARGFATPLHAKLASGALSWQDALPESVRMLIAERLQAQVNPLLEGTAKWMEEPSVVMAIAKMLQEKVENIPLVGPMAKSFLTPDRVETDIVPRLQNVILSGTTRQLVMEKMTVTLNEFWSHPIGQYVSRLSVEDLSGLLDKLIDNLFEHALSNDTASREMFRDLIVNGLVAGANEKTVGDLLRRIFEALAGWNLRDLYIKHTDDVDRLITKWWRYLRGQLIDGIPALLEALSIRQVVREQVASYPIPTLEKLILSVVNHELRMITILGGVLGAMIGLVQALLIP